MAACNTPTREARRMVKRAALLADALFGCRDVSRNVSKNNNENMKGDVSGNVSTISPVMDDDFFNGQATLTTSPELERAAAYYARKKQYAKAAHAALYSGFVQQHYNEKEAAMRSFKEAKHRAKANIALTNLAYNMCRLVQLKKYQPNLIAIQ